MGTTHTFTQKIFLFSSLFPQAKPLGVLQQAHIIIGPTEEVHSVKILDEYEVEVAILSICKPGDVTYVMISRETERFVNEIHIHEGKTPDPVGNCSKIFKKLKKARLTNKER